MKPKKVVVLCMECGFQYVTRFILWEKRQNHCSNCTGSKAQLIHERVNE